MGNLGCLMQMYGRCVVQIWWLFTASAAVPCRPATGWFHGQATPPVTPSAQVVRDFAQGQVDTIPSLAALYLRQVWVGAPLAQSQPQLVRACLASQNLQPYYLTSPARGVKRWHRSGSRVLHVRPARGGYPANLSHYQAPLSSAWTGAKGGPGGGVASLLAPLALDRGYFFPNHYRLPWRPRGGALGVQRPQHASGGARGRAGFLSRKLAARLRLLRGLAGPVAGGARGRRRRLAPSPRRRRYLGTLVRYQRLVRRRQLRLGRLRCPVRRRSRVLTRRVTRWASLQVGGLRRRGLAASLVPGRAAGAPRARAQALGLPYLASGGGLGRTFTPTRLDAPVTHELRLQDLILRFRQPQVRYRPGLMRQWRQHRRVFRRVAQLPWGQRQLRLTRYVSKLRRLTAFSYHKYLQLTVARVLGVSWLGGVTTPARAWASVLLGLVQVSGLLCHNPLAQLYRGDLLTLGGGCVVPEALLVPPLSALRLPPRGRKVGGCSDTPPHLEVDELTLTVVVLQEPRWVGLTGVEGLTSLPFSTLKCYN